MSLEEAIEAEWYNGNIGADARDRLLAAARAEPGASEGLLDEMSEDWQSVERAIWPNGPASGTGSGAYAGLKARIIAALASPSSEGENLEWWHRDVIGAGAEVRYIRGRVRFLQGERWVDPDETDTAP